jgi:hypothetical protein
MDRSQVLDIHVHGIRLARRRRWLRVRPLSYVRPRYLVVVTCRDGGILHQPALFPQLNWWVTTLLLVLPPWPQAVRCPLAPHEHEAHP